MNWAWRHRGNILQASAAILALVVAGSFLVPFPLDRRGAYEWLALAFFMASFF